MSSEDIDEAPPRRAVIGAGKVGGLLARGDSCAVVTRYRGWSALDEAAGDPIAVCVHNDDLASVLTNVPRQRRTDLVFLQPGILDPWLEDHGLEGNTRGLLYFSVPERGATDPVQWCGSESRESGSTMPSTSRSRVSGSTGCDLGGCAGRGGTGSRSALGTIAANSAMDHVPR